VSGTIVLSGTAARAQRRGEGELADDLVEPGVGAEGTPALGGNPQALEEDLTDLA